MKPHCLPQIMPRTSGESEIRRAELPLPSVKGLLAGTLAVGVGLLILMFDQGSVGYADLGVLGVLFMGAMIGGSAADRMVERRLAAESPKGWMTVVVTSSGPSGMEASLAKPKASPSGDPERRSLSRLARQRRREHVASGM